jgi:hypothetical protein
MICLFLLFIGPLYQEIIFEMGSNIKHMPNFESKGLEMKKDVDQAIAEGSNEDRNIEYEANLEQVERVILRLLEQPKGIKKERDYFIDDGEVQDAEGNTLTWVEDSGRQITPFEVRNEKGRLLAQSWNGREWAVGRYIDDGVDLIVNTTSFPKMETERLERDPSKEFWTAYRGTTWVDNYDISLDDAVIMEARGRLYAKDREMQTTVDPSNGFWIAFKDKNSVEAGAFDEAVQNKMMEMEKGKNKN